MYNASDITVVLAVYSGESYNNFIEAIESVISQTIKVKEIIIVEDGPIINNKLSEVINLYDSKYDFIKIIKQCKGNGVAHAWNLGIKNSRTALIARMDSDDICELNRFEIQLDYLNNNKCDILGSYISEFDNTGFNCSIRKVPLEHQMIIKLMNFRNPLNHVTVIFKKDIWLKSGGYYQMLNHVDWLFWFKLRQSNACFANIPMSLVRVRKDHNQLNRRSGLKYISSELKFYSFLYKNKFVPLLYCVYNFLIRLPFRILPLKVRKILFSLLR